MTTTIEPRTLKGFRDFLPETMVVRNRVKKVLTGVFERFGFESLETPSLEYQDILLGKYGEEADRLVYTFKDPGERDVALRYDLTVPASRVIAQYRNDLPLPFKRYQIQRVWRADKPQKGRYREVEMCDIDTFGSESVYSDAEIIAVIDAALKELGFEEYKIRINSRDVLFAIMDAAGIEKEKRLSMIQTIDKLDKKSEEEVKKELSEKGFNEKQIDDVFMKISSAVPDQRLDEMFTILDSFGISEKNYSFDPTLSRGLDYYTGVIFETEVTKPVIGSITGGGRYDELVGMFLGETVPAVGTTLGLDRIVDVIMENNLWGGMYLSSVDVLVAVIDGEIDAAVSAAKTLMKSGLRVMVYPDDDKVGKQFKYADKKGIPYVVLVGPEEKAKGAVQLKDMKTGEQKELAIEQVAEAIG
jgi:histidyl-tRNA synthetase